MSLSRTPRGAISVAPARAALPSRAYAFRYGPATLAFRADSTASTAQCLLPESTANPLKIQTWTSRLTITAGGLIVCGLVGSGCAACIPAGSKTTARKCRMISLTAEYALRAVVWIAGRPDAAVGTRDIAEATQVPVGYMSKVLQSLARSHLVRSRPGRSGGFVLARKPGTISVLDIVQAVDPVQRIERCPLGHRLHNGKLCPLHRRLDQALAMIERAFADSSIAELMAEAADENSLCAASDTPQTKAAQPAGRSPKRGRRPRVTRHQQSVDRNPAKVKHGRRAP